MKCGLWWHPCPSLPRTLHLSTGKPSARLLGGGDGHAEHWAQSPPWTLAPGSSSSGQKSPHLEGDAEPQDIQFLKGAGLS